MTYQVAAVAGDCLCSIGRRTGFSNCGALRGRAENVAFLDVPLAAGDMITIPSLYNFFVYPQIAFGRRWTFRVPWPEPVPHAKTVTFSRAVVGPINDVGVSRFSPRGTSGNDRDPAWPNHAAYGDSVAANLDPDTFRVVVTDPDRVGINVPAYLEALRPTYDALGAPTRNHVRFTGGDRAARSLVLQLQPFNDLGVMRHRSCYLRLVADTVDKNVRPGQMLLVTDMVAQGDEIVEILDQDITVRYEDPACPRAAGERCILARRQIPLRRGNEVGVEARIVRAAPSVVGAADDGVVTRQDLRRRLLVNNRRIYAQEELIFRIDRLDTVDPPSNMLTVADADGALATGVSNGNGLVAGEVGFRLTVTPHGGVAAAHVVPPIGVLNGHTPHQTAQAIEVQVNLQNIANLVVTVHQNQTIDGQPRGSADVMFAVPGALVTIDQLTLAAQQDSTQVVEVVAFAIAAFAIRSGATNMFVGGRMQRNLYRSFVTDPTKLNLFIIDTFESPATNGHTIGSQAGLLAQYQPDATIENCLTLRAGVADGNIDNQPATLSHEFGHALTDSCGHADDDASYGSIMEPITNEFGGGQGDHKRIFAAALDFREVVFATGAAPALGLRTENYSMHARILAHPRILLAARPP